MNIFLRIGSYLLHPLLMPLMATSIYYLVTPRFVDIELIRTKILAVAIITILIPLITFYLLKNIKVVESIHLREVRERKIPLMIQALLTILIIKQVFDPYNSPEMYYFFVGVLFSGLTAIMLVFLKFKISLHQMGISGVTMFLIALSVHFQVNMLAWIAFFIFANGWIATSRLHTHSHTGPELIIGFFVGLVPQLILINFWL